MSFSGDLYPTAGAEAVMSVKGDMVDYDTARQRLGIGSANQILQVKSNLPSWETVPLADTVLTTAGDILYENATPELARLAIGSNGDVLTLSGGLPSWSAPAGGGATELVDSTTLTSSNPEINTTFTSISGSDISQLFCVFQGGCASSSYVQLQVNGLTGTNYSTFGTHSNNGSSINIYTSGANAFTLCSNNAGGAFAGGTSTFFLRCGNSSSSPASGSQLSYSGSGSDALPNASWNLGGGYNGTVNAYTAVRVFANSGDLIQGSKLSIYKMSDT